MRNSSAEEYRHDPQISEETKAVRKTTDATLDEIKDRREDIQPGYATNFRQVQADIRG